MFASISAEDFIALLHDQDDLYVLDIRTQIEYDAMHLEYSVDHKPLHDIDFESFVSEKADDKPLYILCKAGPRAEKAAQLLTYFGLDNVVVINGGILGCIDHGADIQKSERPLSDQELGQAIQESFHLFMQRYAG